MSSDIRWILEVMPSVASLSSDHPKVLDLGGGRGVLRKAIERRGYLYVNLDIQRLENGEPSIIGDAHLLPFRDGCFDIVISKDTLEHFIEPQRAVDEVYRILKANGYFVVWVPFMHPFHGDDYYRYSPLGLCHLLRKFQIVHFDNPQWIFTVLGLAIVEVLKRLKLGFLEKAIKSACYALDGYFTRRQTRPSSFANAYRVVAKKKQEPIQ